MTVACYLDERQEVSDLMRCFAQGCGGKIVKEPFIDATAEDHAVVAKTDRCNFVPKLRKVNLPFWYIDSAYIQLVGQRYSRIERSGYWPNWDTESYSLDRALAMGVRPQPWRKTGSHVVLCLPGPMAGADFHGPDHMRLWWDEIQRRLEASTDRPIRVRHKKARETRPLAADLEDAWCLVTHSSTAAVEAVIAGIPVFCNPTCAAEPVGVDASCYFPIIPIEAPEMPDRESWLAALAWRQFSRAELRSGMAWEHVRARQ